ncbi:MAG TPA: quinone oxidoreductase [Casimicrobiaceae bacterium]
MTTTSPTIRIEKNGGPEEMKLVDLPVGEPGPGEIRIRHHACGINFIDVYQRSGVYTLPMPLTLGMEGAGVVEAVGAGVTHLKPGDRAAYAANPPGSYSLARVMPAKNVCKLPDAISFETGASMMLKGMTAQYLLRRTLPQEGLQAGDHVLFHAAAGGVGLIACQWARALGVTMIGTAGSDEKAALARQYGCAHTIVYTRENFVERVKEITNGKGVPVVYDSIGKDTFPASLDCLSPRGFFVSFGSASGPVPPFNIMMLSQKGSLYATRPTLFTHAANRESLNAMASELFGLVKEGKIKPDARQTFPLAQAADAHRTLESRKTTGATLLIP